MFNAALVCIRQILFTAIFTEKIFNYSFIQQLIPSVATHQV